MEILFMASIFLVIYPGRVARWLDIGNRWTGGRTLADRLPAISRNIRLGGLGYAILYLIYVFLLFVHR